MEEKWIMEYCSSHKILLVGEGDFSFALCLAKAFGTAVNIVATTREKRGGVMCKYADARKNLTELVGLGCTILDKVSVHTMTQHHLLENKTFDRIIFNFPHAGFYWSESHELQIEFNQTLVSGFLRNAIEMLNDFGEVHITHKTSYPYSEWNIIGLAEYEGFYFVAEEEFDQYYYPGYNNKKGFGPNCDQSFYIGQSSTFKFAMEEQ